MEISTDRLLLRLGEASDIPFILAYHRENEKFHAPFEPQKPQDFFHENRWAKQLETNHADFENGQSMRLWLFKRKEEKIAGSVNFTNVVRGPFQACNLGYGLDENEQGKGLMSEALKAAISFVFQEWRLHRIQANYLSHNRRSAKLLEKLGFEVEGLAKNYLLIAGKWRDHVLSSLTNPHWIN